MAMCTRSADSGVPESGAASLPSRIFQGLTWSANGTSSSFTGRAARDLDPSTATTAAPGCRWGIIRRWSGGDQQESALQGRGRSTVPPAARSSAAAATQGGGLELRLGTGNRHRVISRRALCALGLPSTTSILLTLMLPERRQLDHHSPHKHMLQWLTVRTVLMLTPCCPSAGSIFFSASPACTTAIAKTARRTMPIEQSAHGACVRSATLTKLDQSRRC